MLCFSCTHLIPLHLRLVIQLLLSLSWLLPLLLLNLILQKTSQHIFFSIHSLHPLFLLSGYSLLVVLNLFFLELSPMDLSLLIADCCLIFIDIMQCLLILHELVIVLFVYWIFLRLELTSHLHFFVIFLHLSLLHLFLFESSLFPEGKLLECRSFLLLNNHFFSNLFVLQCLSIIVMHNFFSFYDCPTLLFLFPTFFLVYLCILWGQR